MSLVNYFRNPRFKTDSNADGFADGVDTSWPGFNGVNKPTGSILTVSGGGPLVGRIASDYAQFFQYDYGSDEGSLGYIHIGETAAGSFAIKNITAVSTTGQPVTVTCAGHGLHPGEKIEIAGLVTSPYDLNGIETVSTTPTSDTFTVNQNVTSASDQSGTMTPRGYLYLPFKAYHYLIPSGLVGGNVTLKLIIDQMNSGGTKVGTTAGGSNTYAFPSSGATWQNLVCYAPSPLDAACDHLRFAIQLSTLGTEGERIQIWIAHACFTKTNGGSNWFDGVYGGTWDGTADASTSTQDDIAISGVTTEQGAIVGRPFVITGSDFGWSGTMNWDSTPVQATEWSPNIIGGVIPSLPDGDYDIYILPTEGGGAVNYSTPGDIDLGSTLTISALTPNNGFAGTPVVISGSGFGSSAGTVRFTQGSLVINATITAWTDTAINITAPDGLAPGAATVTVVSGDTVSSGLTFTYPTAGTYELKVKTSTGWQNQPVLWTREATEMDDADFFYAKGSIWEKNAIKLPADPPPPPPPPPDEHADGTVYTVDTMSTDAIQTALNNCNAYDVVQLKAGIYQRGTNNALNIPDYVRLRGTGIYKQSVPGGGGGTWIQAGLRWGSYVRCGTNSSGVGDVTKGFLAGYNAVGRGAYHFGQQKNTTVSGNYAYTKSHGCTGSRFCFVRFKGGTDGPLKTVQLKLAGGAPGPTVQYRDVGGELFGNGSTYRRYWASDSLGDYFLIDNIFEDCEFERPQGSTLSSQPFPLASGCAYVKTWEDGHTSLEPHGNWPYGNPGSLHNLWVDCRVGGNEVRGNHWLRCHFGVKNNYIIGIDGYGSGITLLHQPCPTTPNDKSLNATRPEEFGPSWQGSSEISSDDWNATFDWSQVDHMLKDNRFTDCLMEWTSWYPMNPCDWGRNYSTWHGTKEWLAGDYGNVPEYFNDASGNTRLTSAKYGWGNPPGSKWVLIPDQYWTTVYYKRVYHKGRIDKSSSIVGEMGRLYTDNCFTGTGSFPNYPKNAYDGSYWYGGYRNPESPSSGVWPPADTGLRHPASPLFPTDWSGVGTTYTPSPYD